MSTKEQWMINLVGRVVTKVLQSPDQEDLLFLIEDEDPLWLRVYADCCARPYVHEIDSPEFLLGRVFSTDERKVDLAGFEEYCDATFYAISTIKGTSVIELRVEHNGYYGGALMEQLGALPSGWETWKVLGDQ